MESFSLFFISISRTQNRVRQVLSQRTFCYVVVTVDIIATCPKLHFIFFLWKFFWFLLDVSTLYCSLVSPGLSFGTSPRLAEPAQCVEGFSDLLGATVLIRIFLISRTGKRTTFCLHEVHPRCRMGQLIPSPSIFIPTRALRTLPNAPAQASLSGPASALRLPRSIWAWGDLCYLELPQKKPAALGKQPCASVWGIPSSTCHIFLQCSFYLKTRTRPFCLFLLTWYITGDSQLTAAHGDW